MTKGNKILLISGITVFVAAVSYVVYKLLQQPKGTSQSIVEEIMPFIDKIFSGEIKSSEDIPYKDIMISNEDYVYQEVNNNSTDYNDSSSPDDTWGYQENYATKPAVLDNTRMYSYIDPTTKEVINVSITENGDHSYVLKYTSPSGTQKTIRAASMSQRALEDYIKRNS